MNPTYLDELNPQQRQAVEYVDGPQLVIAGAGSGKTRVLTYKVVHLLNLGLPPESVLALTFTNKAAREMKERIRAIVGPVQASRVWMGTFHSIFLRILRQHSDRIGFPPGFTIYDATDSRSLVKMIVRDLGLDEKIYKPSAIASDISRAKNSLISADQYARDPDFAEADRRNRRPMTFRIYSLYTERCRVANAMDFDDILFYMNILLRDNPDILNLYREAFGYVLVDEYQDTNFAQALIVTQLVGARGMLCAVGDDAQSIYSFRGADISNILGMEKRFPGLRIFKLERNYRSTQCIVNAAGSLIDHNRAQMRKHVYSENEKGSPLEIFKTYSDLEEAAKTASMIAQSKNSAHDSYEDYVILYRTNAQSRVLEEALRHRNIPYRIYGGLSFYQRKEVKDAVAYFRLCANPDDDEALRRVINYPARGIGDTTMKKIIAAASKEGVSLFTALKSPAQYGISIHSGTARKLADFAAMINEFVADAAKSSAFEVGQLVFNRTGILKTLAHDNTPESISKQENLSELLSGLKEFTDIRVESGEPADIGSFLSEVSLATDLDEEEQQEGPKVTMMTVHAAKGLEFKHVFIVGVEEDLFPSALASSSDKEIEEERRLLYVAITRAEKTCTLSFAGSRFRNGKTEICRPSRFLFEIDPLYTRSRSGWDVIESKHPSDHIDFPGRSLSSSPSRADSSGPAPTAGRRLKRISTHVDASLAGEIDLTADGSIRKGSRVEHRLFGQGDVVRIELAGDSELVHVDFGNIGMKKLLLKYAKIKVLKF